MFIAQKLKKENIAEYLLYMWQIEDLIRAFNLDIDAIHKHIISQYEISDDEKKTLLGWYESLIDMMRSENVQKNGHLQLNKNTLSQLEEFHFLFFNKGKNDLYNNLFYKISPSIHQLKIKQNSDLNAPIEICFNFLYGILLLRMQKKEISAETQHTQKEISKFIAMLSSNYISHSKGELILEDEELT